MEEVATEVTIRNFPPFIVVHILFTKLIQFGSGMRNVILLMYMSNYVGMSEKHVKIYYHSFDLYGIPFYPLAAWLADCYLGYWYQFIYFELALLPLTLLLPISSLPIEGIPVFELVVAHFVVNTIALALTSITSPLIGDQFVLPQQSELYTRYLMADYWLANIMYAVGNISGPMVRNMTCFGFKECYIVPIMLSCVCYNAYILTMAACWKLVKKVPPNGRNVCADVVKIVFYAIKRKSSSDEKKDHWLDYASDKYEESIINDIKRLSMVYMLFPILFITTLSVQEVTAFLFQAKRMNGDIGFFTILPDQMYAGNTIFCVLVIPVFEYVIFPFLNKRQILTRRIQRVFFGAALYAVSFAYAGTLSLAMEGQMHPAPSPGKGQLRIFNNLDCNMSIKVDDANWGNDSEILVSSMNFIEILNLDVSSEQALKYSLSCGNDKKSDQVMNLQEGELIAYHWHGVEGNRTVERFVDDYRMQENSFPVVRMLFNINRNVSYTFNLENKVKSVSSSSEGENKWHPVYPRDYTLFLDDSEALNMSFKVGSHYAVLVNDQSGKLEAKLLSTFHYESYNILWMVPQYILNVFGEILYVIAWREFIYTEAPVTMKAMVGSVNQIVASCGNALVVGVEALVHFDKMSTNFYTYCGCMVGNLIVFLILIFFYKESGAINKRGARVLESENKD